MPVGSVAAYQAALESTNTALSYAMEATWTTAPATTFQSVRLISESLSHKKTRIRPPEVRGDRQSAAALTSQEAASGTIVMPVYSSEAGRNNGFDDFMMALLGGDPQLPTNIGGVGGDITLTSAGVLSSATANKFSLIWPGQIIKLLGFSTASNNTFARVVAVNSAQNLTLAPMYGTFTTETPAGAAVNIFFNALKNGTAFKSIYGQQRLDNSYTKWFRYPGMYPTKGTLSLTLGQFMQASFDMAVQQEQKGTVDMSAGGVVLPPTTRVFDPVNGFRGAFWNDQPIAAGLNSCGLDLSNEGAAAEYFLGSALAQGMLGGTFMASAKMDLAFRDFTYYDLFRAETAGAFSVRYGDQAGNSYFITLPNAVLLFDDGANMTGPNKMLMSSVTVEASPDAVSGATIIVNKFPATAG